MRVTIYPMLHIANQSFYEQLSKELVRCQYVLYEGVTWRSGNKRHPLYDLVARNLGAAAQEKALQMPAEATKINLDMGCAEFRKRFLRLPLWNIAGIVFLRYLLWLSTLPRVLRNQFVRYGLLRRRRGSQNDDGKPLNQLILRARDKLIVENLTKFFRASGWTDESVFAGIVFGAGHMPAITAGLRSLGYRPGTRRWVEVFRQAANEKDVV
jgi:hypothetical protein